MIHLSLFDGIGRHGDTVLLLKIGLKPTLSQVIIKIKAI